MRARRGFTLIELTLAMVLLAVGLLALLGALARALQQTQTARLRHAALRQAESVADSLAFGGIAAAGSLDRNGFRLEWRPEPCAAGTCVRIVARTETPAGDSLHLLARVADAAGEP